MGRLGAAIDSAYAKPGPRCSVRELLPTMKKEDREDLLLYLARPPGEVFSTTITEELAKLGYDIHVDALRHHRKSMMRKPGGCHCPPGVAGVPERTDG